MDELNELDQVRTAATAMAQVMRLLPEHLRSNALELAAAIDMELSGKHVVDVEPHGTDAIH